MSTLTAVQTALCWHRPDREPFALAGFAWYAVEHRYRRLPQQTSYPLPPAVDQMANNTAGGHIRVQTDSTLIGWPSACGWPVARR